MTASLISRGFLRASGGVSKVDGYKVPCVWFSPRKRRCFHAKIYGRAHVRVFSAQAEVFLLDYKVNYTVDSFLRASGGVSVARHQVLRDNGFSPRKRRCFQYLN